MCLETKTLIPRVATHDIICYKILNEKLESLFLGFRYKTNIVYKILLKETLFALIQAHKQKTHKYWTTIKWAYNMHLKYHFFLYNIFKLIATSSKHYKLEKGFFHSYQDLDTAILTKSYYRSVMPEMGDKLVIMKCIIPKGSFYYTSVPPVKELCSTKIKILHHEIISKEQYSARIKALI